MEKFNAERERMTVSFWIIFKRLRKFQYAFKKAEN